MVDGGPTTRRRRIAAAGRGQRGVALLTVLLVVFLGSLLAARLATLQQTAIRRSEILAHQRQAQWYVLGAEEWARQLLRRDRADSERDTLDEPWAQLPPALTVPGGALRGHVEDLQGRLNLNNLTLDNARGEYALRVLERLLELLDLDPAIAPAIADWVDADHELRLDGAEDGDYLRREIAHLAANRPLVDLSELRLVQGVDEDAYRKLLPLLAALPAPSALNVNTAPAPLLAAALAALTGRADGSRGEALVRQRQRQGGFTGVAAFLSAAGVAGSELAPTAGNGDNLAVASGYFRVDAEARIGAGRARLRSVLARDANGDSRVLRRVYGFDDGLGG